MSSRAWQVKFDPKSTYTRKNGNLKHLSNGKEARSTSFMEKLRQRLYTRGTIYVLLLIAAVSFWYWSFLTSLYLVDEVFDSKGPRELGSEERFTMRMLVSKKPSSEADIAELTKVVTKYAICPSVAEIQLLLPHGADAAVDPRSFDYPKTHCPVYVDISAESDRMGYSSSLSTHSRGVLLLNSQVVVDCRDLTFAHSVWRSGGGLVGFFPRLHTQTEAFHYYGHARVWWNNMYSLLLPDGVFAEADFLQKSAESKALTNVLSARPECYHTGLSMWAASTNSRGALVSPPVWVKVPTSGSVSADAFSDGQHAECMNLLSKELNVKGEQLRYSDVKAIRASDTIFW